MATTAGSEPAGPPGGRLRAIGVAAAVVVVGFVLGTALSAVVGFGIVVLGVDLTLTAGAVLGLVVLQGIAFPLTAIAYLRVRNTTFRRFLRTHTPTFGDVLWTIGGYVLVLVLVFVITTTLVATNAPTASRADASALQDPGTLLWLIPLAFLLIGPGEELLFRGIVQGRLRESFGPVAAVVLASASFAPAHVLALTGSTQALAISIGVLFVPALVLGAAYERTGNLLVPIVIHGAYDATLFGLAYLTFRYGPETTALL